MPKSLSSRIKFATSTSDWSVISNSLKKILLLYECVLNTVCMSSTYSLMLDLVFWSDLHHVFTTNLKWGCHCGGFHHKWSDDIYGNIFSKLFQLLASLKISMLLHFCVKIRVESSWIPIGVESFMLENIKSCMFCKKIIWTNFSHSTYSKGF